MKISANISLLYPEADLLSRVALAKQDGFRAIEVQFPYEIEAQIWADCLHQHDMTCVLINIPAGDLMQGGDGLACQSDSIPEFESAVARARLYAKAMNVKQVNLLAGRARTQQKPQAWRTLINNARYAANAFREDNITLNIEAINHHDMPEFLVNTLDDMSELIAAINQPNVRMQLDIYHMAKMGLDPLACLQTAVDFVGHVQIADCPNRHEPFTGQIDWLPIFEFLSSSYNGWVGAEYRPSMQTSNTLAWAEPYLN